MKVFDLPVMDRTRKSFYGKAKVIEHDNGRYMSDKLFNIGC